MYGGSCPGIGWCVAVDGKKSHLVFFRRCGDDDRVVIDGGDFVLHAMTAGEGSRNLHREQHGAGCFQGR